MKIHTLFFVTVILEHNTSMAVIWLITTGFNHWDVPHYKWLIWKYRCHINVECISSVKAIKYIYKYVYKGHDHTTMEFGTCQDEVKQYLDARYVSACEALWRIYHFHMHKEYPSVVRLQVHLPNQ